MLTPIEIISTDMPSNENDIKAAVKTPDSGNLNQNNKPNKNLSDAASHGGIVQHEVASTFPILFQSNEIQTTIKVWLQDQQAVMPSLLEAAVYGPLSKVQRLLREGEVTITEKDKHHGYTALLLATADGTFEVMQWLLQKGGAKITEKDNSGNTALLYAASEGWLDKVQWLLQEGGAKITEKNNDGNTALVLAAWYGKFDVVEWLLVEGGFIFTKEEMDLARNKSKDSMTLWLDFCKFLSVNLSPSLKEWIWLALFTPTLTECVPLTQILAYTGKDKALLLDESLSLLFSLFESPQKKALGLTLYQLHEQELQPLLCESQQQIIKRVLDEKNTAPDSREDSTQPANTSNLNENNKPNSNSSKAVSHGEIEQHEVLLTSPALIQSDESLQTTSKIAPHFINYKWPQEKKELTASLLIASKEDKLTLVQCLLQEDGAVIRDENKNGSTALLLAVEFGKLEMVQWLLREGGSTITEKNSWDYTALMIAAKVGKLEMVQWMLQEGGATITKTKYEGNTALLYAAMHGRLAVVQWMLREGGATITEKNYDGETALLYAAMYGHLDVVQWLLGEGGATIAEKDNLGNTALLIAARFGRLNVVQWLLLKGGATIAEKDNHGYTALLGAALNGKLNVVQWLLGEGRATITERDYEGNTALLYAAVRGHLKVVQWLLRQGGATITEKDNNGQTALLYAAKYGQLDVVQWLLREGRATITEKNNDGQTALLCAAATGKLDLIQWLLVESGFIFTKEEIDLALKWARKNKRDDVALWLDFYKFLSTNPSPTLTECIHLTQILAYRSWDKASLLDKSLFLLFSLFESPQKKALGLALYQLHEPELQPLLCESQQQLIKQVLDEKNTAHDSQQRSEQEQLKYNTNASNLNENNKPNLNSSDAVSYGGIESLDVSPISYILPQSDKSIQTTTEVIQQVINNKGPQEKKEGEPSLLSAAADGQLDEVKRLLREGEATITEKSKGGNTALLWAAEFGHLDVMQWLLRDGGATITEKDDYGNTALLKAASGGWLAMVQWLLVEGGFWFIKEEVDLALSWARADAKNSVALWLDFFIFLSMNPSLPLTECIPLTQILAYTGEDKAPLLDKSLSLLFSLFESSWKKALGLALYQLHEQELQPLFRVSQRRIIERQLGASIRKINWDWLYERRLISKTAMLPVASKRKSDLEWLYENARRNPAPWIVKEGKVKIAEVTEKDNNGSTIQPASISNVTNEQQPDKTLDQEAVIPSVEGYYSGEDIDLLIKALLKQDDFVIKKDYLVTVKFGKGHSVEELDIYVCPYGGRLSTYVLPATSKDEGLGHLGQLIGSLTSRQVYAIQVLFPYKVSRFEHWVSILVHYQDNQFRVTVYDSLANAKTADETIDEVINFMTPLTTANVIKYPLQKPEKIQVGNVYCGGFTAHVIAEAATLEDPDGLRDIICIEEFLVSLLRDGNDDITHRANDAMIVGTQKPDGYRRFASKGDGHQSPDKKAKSEEHEQEVHHHCKEEFIRRFNHLSQANQHLLSEKLHKEKNNLVNQLNATKESHKAAIDALSSYRNYCREELKITIEENPFAIFFKPKMDLQSIEIEEDMTSLDVFIKEKLVTFDSNHSELLDLAKVNPVAKEIRGKDNSDAYRKSQYYQRLAKAMAGTGEGTKEVWDFIKHLDAQESAIFYHPLILELQTFITLHDVLYDSLNEYNLFHFLNNSKRLTQAPAFLIERTCDRLLQAKLDPVNQQNVGYVLSEVIQWLLQKGFTKISEKNGFGEAPLLLAAGDGQLNVVMWLLREVATMDEKYTKWLRWSEAAFMLAAQRGQLEVLQFLLKEYWGIIATKDNEGNTVLLLAAKNDQLEVVQWLLREGKAEVTEKNYYGDTVLMLAAKLGQLEMVQWLLREGWATITEKNEEGNTVLLCAAKHGMLPLVQWLLKDGGATVTEKNIYGNTALLNAAAFGKLNVVQWLLQEEGFIFTNEEIDLALSLAHKNNRDSVILWLDFYKLLSTNPSLSLTEPLTSLSHSKKEKSVAKSAKRHKPIAGDQEANITEQEHLQLMFARAKEMATQLTCEGRFFLTKETLEQLPKEERAKRLILELENAWELATKRDHPTGAEKNKEQQLLELQDFYYSLQNPIEDIHSSCFFELFEEIARAYPNKLAVIYDTTQLSYQELNEKANQLAHYFIDLKKEKNWENGTCIALFFENSIEAIISILALMKAGLAYLPLTVDLKLSNERLTAYIEESGVQWLLAQDSIVQHGFIHFVKNKIAFLEIKCFSECQHKNKKNPAIEIDPNQLAYVIFSSGSTGKPKGIQIAHRGLVNPVKAVQNAFQITSDDRIGWHALLTFDASLLDIMTALGTGATSVIIPQAIRTDGVKLTDYLKTHRVSIITLVPTVLETLNPEALPELRGYISTGEAGKKGLFKHWHQTGRLQEPRIGLNGHGPTETSICFALGRYQADNPITPIGDTFVPGFKWFIMKPPSEGCPYPRTCSFVNEGEEGELYLMGSGLALGYLDTKASYQQRFRTIFHPDKPNKLIKIYQTGDVVRWMNNALYFVRRLDEQYKYLGELLHPGAIEEAIHDYKNNNKSDIDHAKVMVEEAKDSLPVLRTHLKEQIENVIDEKWVRSLVFYLQHHPFCTFVPSRFSVVKEWPVNVNGKLDAKQLSQQVKKTYYSGSALQLSPTEDIEKTIAKLWQEILDIPKEDYSINLDDHFFELGGDSIRIDRLLEKLSQTYPQYVKNIAQFAIYPSLRALVFQVRAARKEVQLYPVKWFKGEKSFNQSVQNKEFPVILIHSVMGCPAADYKHIVKYWQSIMGDRPLLGIRCPSLDEPGYIASSIEELASDYIYYLQDRLNSYQGPLILMGYSAGGTIAYEMARQLQLSKRPAAVCCIDTPSVTYYQTLSQADYAAEIFQLMQHAGIRVMGLNEAHHGIRLDLLQQFTKREQLAIYFRHLMEKLTDVPQENRKRVQALFATLQSIIPNQLDYQLKPIDGAGLLAFSDTQKGKCRGDKRLSWPKTLALTIFPIEGKHLDLVDDEAWVKEKVMPYLRIFCEQQSTLSMLPTLKAFKDQLIKQYSRLKLSSPKRVLVKEGYVPAQLKKHGETVLVDRLASLFSSDRKNIVLLGDTGAGKTSILKFIKSQWAEDKDFPRFFTLMLEPKLQHFSNKRFKKMTTIECQLETVLKTSFLNHSQFHEEIKEEGKLLSLLRSIEKEVLILLDNYEKITDDNYSNLQLIIKYLIKKTSFQILLTTSVHAAPQYYLGSDCSIFTVEPWIENQRRLFARQHYNSAVEKQVIIESEFSLLLKNPRYLSLYCAQFANLKLQNENPIPPTLLSFLEKLELSQWLNYFKKADTQKRKKEAKVPFDPNKLNTYSLSIFRIMCETEFGFIKKQAKKCLSKDSLLFDDLYADSLDKTSLSLSSLSTTEDDPLHGAVRTGFIKALVIDGQPSNHYQFQSMLFRDYFYAINWVDNYTSTIQEDTQTASHELETHLYNPSYKTIWSLVTGLLAKSETKDKFQLFVDKLFSTQALGSYLCFLQTACLQEAKVALSTYYDNTVQVIAKLLKNCLARLDDDYLATKVESSLIIQLIRQHPFYLNEPAIIDLLIKNRRLNYFSQLVESESISLSVSGRRKEKIDLPKDKKSIENLLESRNDLSTYFYSFKDQAEISDFLVDIMKKNQSIHVLNRACYLILESCCEPNQKTMNLLLAEIKNQHQKQLNDKNKNTLPFFKHIRSLSKREMQLFLILELSICDKNAKSKNINEVIEKTITKYDRSSNLLFLSLLDYSKYLDQLDLNPLEPEEILILFKSTANPLFKLFKRFTNNNEMLIKLVPLIVQYLEEGLTLYFKDDKRLVLMDGQREETFFIKQIDEIKNSIRAYDHPLETLSKQKTNTIPLGTPVNFYKTEKSDKNNSEEGKKSFLSMK